MDELPAGAGHGGLTRLDQKMFLDQSRLQPELDANYKREHRELAFSQRSFTVIVLGAVQLEGTCGGEVGIH